MSILALRGVSKHFGQVRAVDNVSFEVEKGQYQVLVGPSGSGKTTLLLMIGGFETPTSGDILINEMTVNEIPPFKRNTATVFQDYALFPHMSVISNVEFGLKMRKVEKAQRRERALAILKLVGLEGLDQRRPHELSGGERQRVALARSLVTRPDILLLDEPLGALDAALRRQMQRELKNIQQQVGITFVHVTHDQEEAMNVADSIIVMANGVIEDHGSPDRIYRYPMSRFSATFMGDNNLISGEIMETASNVVRVRSPMGEVGIPVDGHHSYVETLSPGAALTFAVRPEHWRVGPFPGKAPEFVIEAVIQEVVYAGPYTNLIASVKDYGDLRVQLHGSDRTDLRVHEAVSVGFDAKHAWVLSGRG